MILPGHRLFAAVYDRVNAPLERRVLGARRSRLVGELTGEVLDIGAGTGANLAHFRAASAVVVTEPDEAMRTRLAGKLGQANVPVRIASAPAESLPFPDDSFDAVVCTLVLCTVPDPDAALLEIRRVLRPSGRLVVLEHVRGTGRAARWQDMIDPVWRLLAAGCRTNRDTRSTIERAGFTFLSLEHFQALPQFLPAHSWVHGVATPT